ncbi:MAG: tRNA (cytidine(34)-2'-O)-methyltransferase [Defluviitaleaceae bacterium]|nr:tRNA (cytidine(34)-2'-O)-methyltransferase [Defluviitaleaceae bacterium]
MNAFNIVLHQPEIPHNTGAIGRTCLMTGSCLHLIRPLGFFLDEKSLKRSGLDYWPKIDVNEYDNFADFKTLARKNNPAGSFYFIETSGGIIYTDVTFNPGDYLIFGSETTGLPSEILSEETTIRIPMAGEERSLNLSVAVGIVLYEALRQTGFSLLAN